MNEKHDWRLTVNLTQRQYQALVDYAESQGVKPGPYVRLLVTDDVPLSFYRPVAPPPGQLTLTDA